MLLAPRLARPLAFLAVPLLCAGAASAQSTRLNGPLPHGIAGDVDAHEITPDSQHVVYRADQDADEVFRLHVVPIEGGPAVTLGPAPVAGGDVREFRVSPDSLRAVYRADQDQDEVFELYSVALSGLQPATKLNGPLVPGGDVASFLVTRGRVVYLASQESTARMELYSVPLTGGTPVKLNGELVAGGNVGRCLVSPNGKRVVFVADQNTDEVHELFVVPTRGGIAQVVGQPLDSWKWFEISPDSRRIVFVSDGLHSVSILGGPTSALTSHPQRPLSFVITPDSGHVLFSAPGLIGTGQLHVVPIAGGEAVKLSEHQFNRVHQIVVSPDSQHVAYSLEGGDSVHSVFTVPLAGGEATEAVGGCCEINVGPFSPDSARFLFNDLVNERLYSAPAEGGVALELDDGPLFGGLVTPDGQRVVCLDNWVGSNANVVSLPLTGGTPVRLNEAHVTNGGVADLRLSPDGARVVYRADQDSDDVVELYSVPVQGGPVTKLNPPLAFGGVAGDVYRSLVSPDGAQVVYVADQDVDQVHELYSVRLPGGAPVKLNGPMVNNGDVDPSMFALAISPDSQRVVYLADQEVDGRLDVYSVPIGGGTVVRLSTQAVVSADFDISPDSSRVVFRHEVARPGPAAIHSVPIAGGAPLELTTALPPGYVLDVQVSPDSSRVVFLFDEGADPFEFDVYSVPITGGAPVKLNPPPVPGGRVHSARILPDSSTVIYTGDLELVGRAEAFAVPIGGGSATKLNGPLVAGGSVVGSVAQVDSSHYLYLADQDMDEVVELYAVTLPGLVRTKLGGPLVFGGDVRTAVLAPDASRVVYQADRNANDVFELFSVPLGGGLPTRLNGPLVSGGDVSSTGIWISPDSRRVTYFADQDTNNVTELYSVPLAGGAPEKLAGELAPGGDVLVAYNVPPYDPVLRRVLLLADRAGNDVYGVYVTPLAGAAVPDMLGTHPVAGGDVVEALFARGAVVYRADQDADDVYELYLAVPRVPPSAAR